MVWIYSSSLNWLINKMEFILFSVWILYGNCVYHGGIWIGNDYLSFVFHTYTPFFLPRLQPREYISNSEIITEVPIKILLSAHNILTCSKVLGDRSYQYAVFFLMGLDCVHLVLRPLFGLLYQPRMIDECEAVDGMRIGRGSRSTRTKPTPVPLCPPQIPQYGVTIHRFGDSVFIVRD
jgi:hypothetical protein